ncbi:MAG: phosphoribosyl-AMP cyclohydrolase [Syntrophales bacterium]|nr:phosphoribosyl-AMP cyclohydrolase [Syntrophales bacterium]
MIEPDFEKGEGLVPVIVQDNETEEVLMLAYMNREAWLKTLETGRAYYFSRSRNALWNKGEMSGHVQLIRDILIDCDADTILLKVQQIGGAACHTGYRSCFYRRLSAGKVETVGERVFVPEDVYK